MADAAPSRRGAGWTAFLATQVGSLAAMGFAEGLKPMHLSPADAGLLRAVAGQPGRSQQALAAQLGLLPSRLVAMVDELETRGLVERRRNPLDRRNYALELTEDGRAVLGDIGRAAQANGERFLAPLDDEQTRRLAELLALLVEHHQLAPGVHPGYRMLGDRRPATGDRRASTTDGQPCDD